MRWEPSVGMLAARRYRAAFCLSCAALDIGVGAFDIGKQRSYFHRSDFTAACANAQEGDKRALMELVGWYLLRGC